MTDAVLGAFNVDHEVERFKPGTTESGRRVETLIGTEGLRVGLVTMRAGKSPREPTAARPITVHALDGRYQVALGEVMREHGPGDIVAIAAGVRHAINTLAAGVFRLTFGWGSGLRSA